MSLVRFRFWAFKALSIIFVSLFTIHIMARYGRVSSSTHSLFLTSWQISHFLASIPRPVLECLAFSALSCFCTPAPRLIAWLFLLFSSSVPPLRAWSRGFFCSFLLLYPRSALGPMAFSALFFFCTPAPLLATWLFLLFSSSVPPLRSKVQSIYGYILSSHAEELAN